MSVIAALCSTRAGRTWLGSDTMVASGNINQEIGPKWVVRHPWAVGIAGHLRTINVMQIRGDALLAGLKDVYEFTYRARDLLKEDGYRGGKDSDGPPHYGQMLMLAHPEGTWSIGPDFSVMVLPPDRLWAEGSGRELSLGAAHALHTAHALHPAWKKLTEEEIMRHAIETAITYDSRCGGTAWMEVLE